MPPATLLASAPGWSMRTILSDCVRYGLDARSPHPVQAARPIGGSRSGRDQNVRQLELHVLLLVALVLLTAGHLLQLGFRELNRAFRGGLHQALRRFGLRNLFGH